MLMRTDPFRELDRLTQQVLGTAARPAAMPMDAYRQGDNFYIHLDLPGIDADSISLTVEQNVLTVRAERAPAQPGGAELLINISNDGWFGRSAAPAQHLMMARVRAVENRRWLLRDTNNGYTVSVDPYGRIAAQLSTDIRGELDAPYDFRSDQTFYVRMGDWFPWLCVLVSIILVGTTVAKSGWQKNLREAGALSPGPARSPGARLPRGTRS